MPARNPIPLEGVLNCWNDPYDLPDLLLAVSRSGKTGRLSFSNPEADKTIYVKDGKIVFAESSSDDDGLGQYLLRNGQISLDDFTRVSKLVSPGKRLGALLVAEGVLEPKDLVPAVVGQVRAVILGLFRRTETWYGFKEEDLSRKESITLDMPVAQLVLDGVQLVDSWRRISKGVGNLESVYQVAGATEVEWSRLKLESGPSELLTLLSSPMSIADACAEASIDDFDACRYLWAFKSLEWIDLAEIPQEEAPELAEETGVSEAAEMAEMAEMAAPFPMNPVAPPPPPPPRAADPAKTVINLEPAVPIPQRLVETKVSAVKEPEAPRPPQPPPPRPVPADLHHTQLAVDLPAPPRPSPSTTRPEVAPPKPIPEALHHTQLYVDAPAATPEPARASTGEMMEAILDGRGDAPGTAYEPATPEPAPVPEARSDSATQFFPAASALPPQAPTRAPEPPEEDFFSSSPGFASLSLDYTAAPPPELPPPSHPRNEPSASSFSELAPPHAPHAEEEMPLIEATVIEATAVESAAPLPPALVTTRPSVSPGPAEPAGLEFFAMNDPFRTADSAAPPPTAFATDDPLQYAETSVAASLPTRPRTEELDLDLGQFFNGDDNK
jgi:hypothetical protein